MHTLKVLFAGLILLAICLLLGRVARHRRGMAIASLAFLPLWLIAAIANMYLGVKGAGYSVSEEFPVLLVVFSLPAIAATLVWWKLR